MNTRFKNILGVGVLIVASIAISAIPTHADGLLDPGFEIVAGRTALSVTDPQNGFLGKNVETNGTIEHIDQLFAAAKG